MQASGLLQPYCILSSSDQECQSQPLTRGVYRYPPTCPGLSGAALSLTHSKVFHESSEIIKCLGGDGSDSFVIFMLCLIVLLFYR